ncbi:MurT ligase domain-containing protein [Eggerthellaceae bacterium 3-80]|nr:DUF1727 domain-containing protein [bacterium D16-34]
MGLRYAGARVISAASTWGLKHLFHRPAANFPGKVALYVDPCVIGDARAKLERGSVVVVGTNGKTTVTNLLADVLECAGMSVVCNRTGANLDSGIATSLLHAKQADWGVFESDELWLAKVLPQLKAKYVLLLNLFRDQLDRCGEIDRIQDSIVGALASSPESILVYNADDPLCAYIAEQAACAPGREKTPSIAFGVSESMGLAQNTVTDATMCQRCSTMFTYEFRQYGQLGEYTCPNCGFSRPALNFAAENVVLESDQLSFDVVRNGANLTPNAPHRAADQDACISLHAPFNGAYMVYNLLAVGVGGQLLGCSGDKIQQAIDAFNPQNGRLETFDVAGRHVLLNLAKNPTGFNQNLKIVAQDSQPKVVAFFINDKEADGRDVSWLWDIDFEELAQSGQMQVFAGGIRGKDMQVRLKYADIAADVVDSAEELLGKMKEISASHNAYLIANYTSLPLVKSALEAAAAATADAAPAEAAPVDAAASATPAAASTTAAHENPVVIAHLFPDLLNLYGDGGNVRVLEQRLRWRGIPVEVVRVQHGDTIDLSQVDLIMMGGSPDREQRLASADVVAMRDELYEYVNDNGPLLAICGSYQMLGHEWLLDGQTVKGLGLIDMTTRRPGTSADRLTNNIALSSPLATHPVVGYENHAGRTYLGEEVRPFGQVVSSVGCGNNEQTHADGVLYKNLIGTYLHGPLLAKNPEIADHLLEEALKRHTRRSGVAHEPLSPLDDTAELSANEAMASKLGV